MHIQIQVSPATQTEADTIITFLFEDDHPLRGEIARINHALKGFIQTLIDTGEITGKADQTIVLHTRGEISAQRVIVVGLGKTEDFGGESLRRAIANGAKKARELTCRHLATTTDVPKLSIEEVAQALVEGTLLALYTYHGQKTSNNPPDLPERFTLLIPATDDPENIQRSIKTGVAFADGARLARDLVNLPPNICTPTYLAQRAQEIADQSGLMFEALEEQQMRTLRMGALLGVAQGSDTPPRFIVLEHNARHAGELDTVVLIGKGITFDTGGYNLKSSEGIVGMKADMSGGAAVIGAMLTIAKLNVPLHAVGLIPATDNMISGQAYRPQEVLTASNGKTIEIISTDAEGRLLLADALVYAKRYAPTAVVDIATLTGACVVALGSVAAGLFSTDETLRDALIAAAATTGERVWPLPLFPEYEKALESQTADMKNTGDRRGGVGVSAAFLKNFVDYPAWAHVDMAGMAGIDGLKSSVPENPYLPSKGATGYGARLLAEFVRQWATRDKVAHGTE